MSAWKTVPVGELVESTKTWNPSRSDPDEVFDYIDLSAVDQAAKAIVGAREVTCGDAPSRARQIVSAGDVLVSTVRPNLNGIAKVPVDLDGATASTGFCVLRPRKNVLSSSYLFHWVKSPGFVADMVSKATGASYPAVSDRIVFESALAVPPLPEQRRIAAILDQADALRAKRREALAQLDSLTQAIFIEMFGDPEENGKGLPIEMLGSLCKRITDGTHQSPKWESNGVPFLFISNIVDGQISFDTHKFVSDETYLELTRRCPIELGDVLYTTVGSYGNAAIVQTSRRFAFQRHIAHIKPEPSKALPSFIAAMIQSTGVRRQVDKAARGVAQKTVNLADLKSLVVFAPSLSLQRTFATRIQAIELLKAKHRAALTELDALFASLQHRAFRGEL